MRFKTIVEQNFYTKKYKSVQVSRLAYSSYLYPYLLNSMVQRAVFCISTLLHQIIELHELLKLIL